MSAVKLSLWGVICALLTANPSGRTAVTPEQRQSSDSVRNGRLQTSYAHLPIAFEPVTKDGEDSRTFRARGPGYGLHIAATEAVLALSGADSHVPAQLRMTFPGAERTPHIEGLDRLVGTNNYFIGDDPSMWKTNVPTFNKVRYTDLYPGVDLVFYGNQRELEYDFIVRPGADPSQLVIKFDGAQSVRMDANGDLIIAAGVGEIRQRRPVAYQEQGSSRTLIPAEYVVRQSGEVEFAVGGFDHSRALVIDPILVYSTYLGGTSDEQGADVAVDPAGFMYVTGNTADVSGVTPPAAFVVKINPLGSAVVYTAFLGGSQGAEARGIAVDSLGNAYVTGATRSPDFPIVNGFQRRLGGSGNTADAFVAKLNADGTALSYSTFLGGSMDEIGLGIAVDVGGSAYVVGSLILPFPGVPPDPPDDFPTVNPLQPHRRGRTDGFVAKVNRFGSALVYSTYLGGTSFDAAVGVAVDIYGQAHVLGDTGSTDFPLALPFQPAYGGGVSDAFVAKFNAPGTALLYSSYLGGSDYDQTGGISLDAAGNALLTGVTWSTDFPIVNALQPAHAGGIADAFAAKINGDGSAVLYATYLGGSGNDVAMAVAAEVTGSAIVAGYTESANFPVHDAPQTSFGGNTDAFVTKIDPAGATIVYSTFLGGDRYESAPGVAIDASGNAYVAGPTSSFASPFPVTPDALQPVHGGGAEYDAFLSKIGGVCPPDETASLDIFPQGIHAIPATLLRYQWVIIRNSTTTPIAAPLTLALTDLQNGVFVGSRLTTLCASSAISPIQIVFAGADSVLMPGETTATLLFFVQTAGGGVEYTPRVLRGVPAR